VVALTPSIADQLAAKGFSADKIIAWNVADGFGRDVAAYRQTAGQIERALQELPR
jgi:hypothetical protein